MSEHVITTDRGVRNLKALHPDLLTKVNADRAGRGLPKHESDDEQFLFWLFAYRTLPPAKRTALEAKADADALARSGNEGALVIAARIAHAQETEYEWPELSERAFQETHATHPAQLPIPEPHADLPPPDPVPYYHPSEVEDNPYTPLDLGRGLDLDPDLRLFGGWTPAGASYSVAGSPLTASTMDAWDAVAQLSAFTDAEHDLHDIDSETIAVVTSTADIYQIREYLLLLHDMTRQETDKLWRFMISHHFGSALLDQLAKLTLPRISDWEKAFDVCSEQLLATGFVIPPHLHDVKIKPAVAQKWEALKQHPSMRIYPHGGLRVHVMNLHGGSKMRVLQLSFAISDDDARKQTQPLYAYKIRQTLHDYNPPEGLKPSHEAALGTLDSLCRSMGDRWDRTGPMGLGNPALRTFLLSVMALCLKFGDEIAVVLNDHYIFSSTLQKLRLLQAKTRGTAVPDNVKSMAEAVHGYFKAPTRA
jgi:hypothetical protein